jgi:cation diffusion facilitator CzcD-associated flavoprotein CzcO
LLHYFTLYLGLALFCAFKQGLTNLTSYPGIACDIPAHAYSFTFEGNSEWSSYYAPGAEIEAYLKRVTAKYDAYKYMKFNHLITKCEWNESEGKWHVHIEKVDTGEVSSPALSMPNIPRNGLEI